MIARALESVSPHLSRPWGLFIYSFMSSVSQLEAEIMMLRSKWSKWGKENNLKNSPKKTKHGRKVLISDINLQG